MTSSVMIADIHWNVPYVFKGAKILHDTHSWNDGERLKDLFKNKLLSFRIGKRQDSLFSS